MEYWKQIGYEDCYNREMVDYVQAIGAQVLELQQMDAVSAEPHLTMLRKKLRNELKAGRARGLLPFEEEYWGEYTLAYPNRMIRIALYFWLKLRKKLK